MKYFITGYRIYNGEIKALGAVGADGCFTCCESKYRFWDKSEEAEGYIRSAEAKRWGARYEVHTR